MTKNKPTPARLGFNDDGTLDEIVADNASVHLEQMEDSVYWLSITDATGATHTIWLTTQSKKRRIWARVQK